MFPPTKMASRTLFFFLIVVSVRSFVPGTPGNFLGHQGPSREWCFARNQILREIGVSHPSRNSVYGYPALAVGGSLDATRSSTTESSEYLQNKEELKRVRLIISASFAQQAFGARGLQGWEGMIHTRDSGVVFVCFPGNKTVGIGAYGICGQRSRDLRIEYESFFENFESQRYLPDVQFVDPVTSFSGLQNYKNNVDMLGGRSLLGKVLFQDASIVLHDIEEPGPFRLRTRWTLTVCFKALPWKPVLRFTGISDYNIDGQARVIKQEDFWDSINLRQGQYVTVSAAEGVKDFVGQVLPREEERAPGGTGGAPGQLLRRGKEYDVRRIEDGDVAASRDFDEYPSNAVLEIYRREFLENLSADGLKASGEPQLLTPGVVKKHQLELNGSLGFYLGMPLGNQPILDDLIEAFLGELSDKTTYHIS